MRPVVNRLGPSKPRKEGRRQRRARPADLMTYRDIVVADRAVGARRGSGLPHTVALLACAWVS